MRKGTRRASRRSHRGRARNRAPHFVGDYDRETRLARPRDAGADRRGPPSTEGPQYGGATQYVCQTPAFWFGFSCRAPDVRERDAMPLQTRWATRSGGGSSRVRLGPAACPLPRPHDRSGAAESVPTHTGVAQGPFRPPPRPRARTIATVASATARVRSRAFREGGGGWPGQATGYVCAGGRATHPRRVRSRRGRVGEPSGNPA